MNQHEIILLEDGDNIILPLPDEFLKKLDWKEGDTLIWIDNQDGSWSIKKDDTV